MESLFITGTNACKDDNGGCTQLCLPTPGTRVCKCTDGYKLAPDSRTCDGKLFKSCHDFAYQTPLIPSSALFNLNKPDP